MGAQPVAILDSISPAEAREIAHEAYIYGYPIVDDLRVQYSYFVDRGNPDYKAPYMNPPFGCSRQEPT